MEQSGGSGAVALRYKDRSFIGKSELVPYQVGESASERHARRLTVNLHWRHDLRQWAEVSGFVVTIKNNGHHWILIKPTIRIEWWPSSAKLVFNQQWDRGVHCHDWTQLKRAIEKREK